MWACALHLPCPVALVSRGKHATVKLVAFRHVLSISCIIPSQRVAPHAGVKLPPVATSSSRGAHFYPPIHPFSPTGHVAPGVSLVLFSPLLRGTQSVALDALSDMPCTQVGESQGFKAKNQLVWWVLRRLRAGGRVGFQAHQSSWEGGNVGG